MQNNKVEQHAGPDLKPDARASRHNRFPVAAGAEGDRQRLVILKQHV
jgi:hypothetical protein